MKDEDQSNDDLDNLINDLQIFIDLSFHGGDLSTLEWIKETMDDDHVNCWERKGCNEKGCPAYKNETGRCWLLAGTLCGGKVQGKFAEKYGSCILCDVYKENIGNNRVQRLRELLIILIHSFRLRQKELEEVKDDIKILSGLLPICASCKKIRDDQGYWNQIESYIIKHSEAEFTHGMCPKCLDKMYPEIPGNK